MFPACLLENYFHKLKSRAKCNIFNQLIIVSLARLLCNFELHEGGLIPVKEILYLAESEKENVLSANSSLFGQLIRQLWGDQVKLVKRGPRNQRQNFYLNLAKKSFKRSPNFKKIKTG